MNTNKLKSFAKNARIILLNGVNQRMNYWGFGKNGDTSFTLEAISGGYTFRDKVFDDASVPKKYDALKKALKLHTVEDIIEQAAFTWFNRFISLKILEKNNYINPVLGYVSSELDEPALLHNARLKQENFNNNRLDNLFNRYLADNNEESAFALLVLNFCKNHKLTNKIFGHINDYTELLLPDNLLSSNGIINLINTNDAISDEDYKEVELIGWLYQFYISDKKDQIFKNFSSNIKARAEDIPAATQIFTPKWIVKYMTENSTGNVWLDYKPESTLKSELKYYVETERRDPLINDIIRLTLMDPACGSGHILVEGFDLLLKMYVEEGYTAKNAVTSIIKNNLFGLDIDDRASQLANFAVLLKAGKYNQSLLENPIDTNILAFPEHYNFDDSEIETFIKPDNTDITIEELNKHKASISNALTLLNKGKNLGSVIKTNLPKNTFELVKSRYNYFEEQFNEDLLPVDKKSIWIELKPFIKVLIMLNNKYLSVVANPPYMGAKNMNEELKAYVNKNYPIAKSDLFSVFIERMIELTRVNARMSCITMESWMFLTSFEKLRTHIIDNYNIVSLTHFGWHIIGIAFGTAILVLDKNNDFRKGEYSYLEIKDINPETNTPYIFPIKNNGRFANILQSNFSKIPGSPIAYWVSEKFLSPYDNKKTINDFFFSGGRNKTHNNNKFVRYFWECNLKDIGFNNNWIFYENGGASLKWYGNSLFIVNWTNEARGYYALHGGLLNNKFWDVLGIVWNLVSSGNTYFRLKDKGKIFSSAAPTIITIEEQKNIYTALAFLNSKYVTELLKCFNTTVNTTVGDILKLPFSVELSYKNIIEELVFANIKCAKKSWDINEYSVDYRINEILLLKDSNLLKAAYFVFIEEMKKLFFELHKNEEELNRIFIEIYGLQDELTPEVPLKEITILQDINYINENNELVFKKDEIIKQFLSYAIGCMMGRYSLYKEGLILANSGDTLEEYNKTVYEKTEKDPNHFMPDEDGIVPLMGSGYNFSDDITVRMRNFLEASFGQDTITENINFINECLGMDMDKFLTEKFWQYHYKMYQKKPIYWVFASSNGSFKVLVYMHRMNKYTIQKIRNNYLLRHLSFLRNNIEQLSKKTRTPAEDKLLDKLRNEELECKDYDMLVKDKADKQIDFDLDDGVTANYQKFEGIVVPIK